MDIRKGNKSLGGLEAAKELSYVNEFAKKELTEEDRRYAAVRYGLLHSAFLCGCLCRLGDCLLLGGAPSKGGGSDMTTIAQVKTAIITAMTNADVKTIGAYSVDQLKAYVTAVVAVGRREMRVKNAGQIDYLGERTDEETQKIVEVYGKKMELSVSLDVYAPRSLGAAGCENAAETVSQTLLTALPGGLKLMALSWAESEWDKTYGMFHLAGTAEYTALFTAETGEDDTVFTDFILRGVVETND